MLGAPRYYKGVSNSMERKAPRETYRAHDRKIERAKWGFVKEEDFSFQKLAARRQKSTRDDIHREHAEHLPGSVFVISKQIPSAVIKKSPLRKGSTSLI